MADPGFPKRGSGANLLFGKSFTENLMKMKEILRGGGGALVPGTPLDPPMSSHVEITLVSIVHLYSQNLLLLPEMIPV